MQFWQLGQVLDFWRDLMTRPTIIPHLTVSPAAEAIVFYTKVFKATENMRRMAEDGKRILHCELHFADGVVMLADAFPEHGHAQNAPLAKLSPQASPNPVTISIDMPTAADVNASAARAIGMGAIAETGPLDTFWGTRFAKFRDPYGHRWMMNAPLDM